MTTVILKVLDVTLGLRVKEEEEEVGLDVTQHGERGYVMDESSGMPVAQYAAEPPPAPAPAPRVQPESAGSGAGS
jgi:hypothetical protein